ncbi:hypothetical protein HDU92_000626, partial [Lobulomyces angularis]
MCEKNVRFELTKLCNKWWDFYMKKTKKFCLHCYIFTSEIVEVTAVHRCSPMNTLAKRCFDCLSSSHSYRNELCYKIGNKVKDFSSGWGEGIRFCFICSLPQGSLKHRHFTVPCHTPFRQYISPAVHFIWEIEKLRELFISSTPLGLQNLNLQFIDSLEEYQKFLYTIAADTQLLGATIAFLWLMEVIENREIAE